MILTSLDLRRRTYVCGLAVSLVWTSTCIADGQQGAAGKTPASTPAGAAMALPQDVLDVTWEWVGLQTPKDEIIVPDPENYTLTLMSDGSVALQVDCNRGVSSYTLTEDNRIAFSPIGTTMMMCPEGSLDHDFTSNLERVQSFFQLEGDLLLEQPFDSGTLRFRPATAAAGT